MANHGAHNSTGADARPQDALPLGSKLQNQRFTVGRVLGRGGFGISYMGHDQQLSRLVAIKELFPDKCLRQGLCVVPSASFPAADWNEARRKFLAEARTLARFRHDGIVQVFDCFEENDTAYLVMEYLQGKTLQQIVEERGALPVEEAVRLITFIGRALQEVHQAHIIHRDIKPENIIVCDAPAASGERAVLIDFGLNKQVAAPSSAYGTQQLTRTMGLGSPGYAAPEQYGKGTNLGIYTDIYGLGATLYFLLTAQVPLAAVERINQAITPVQALNPQIAPGVGEAVAHAMAMSTQERPPTVADWLPSLNATPSTSARPSTPHQPTTVLSPSTHTNATHTNATNTGASGSCAFTEVRVSARVLFWPLICACCGQPNDSISKAVQTTRQGKRYIRAEVSDWPDYRDDFFCGACRNHFRLQENIQQRSGELATLQEQSHSQLAVVQQQSHTLLLSEEQKLTQSRQEIIQARTHLQTAGEGELSIATNIAVGAVALAVGTILFSSLVAGLFSAAVCVAAKEAWNIINAAQRRQARIAQAQQQLSACEQQVLALEGQIAALRRQEELKIEQQKASWNQRAQQLQQDIARQQQQMNGAMRALCTCDDAAKSVVLSSSYGSQRTFHFSNAMFAREFETLNHEKLIYTT